MNIESNNNFFTGNQKNFLAKKSKFCLTFSNKMFLTIALIMDLLRSYMRIIGMFFFVFVTQSVIFAGEVTVTVMRGVDQDRIQKVAVFPFDTSGYSGVDKGGVAAADLYGGQLAKTGYYEIVERQHLKQLLDEQALQQTGAIDDKTAIKVGRLAGAQGFLIGSATGKENFFAASIRLVDVETGKTAWQISVSNVSAKDIAPALTQALDAYHEKKRKGEALTKNIVVTKTVNQGLGGFEIAYLAALVEGGGPAGFYSGGLMYRTDFIGGNVQASHTGIYTGLSIFLFSRHSLEITGGVFFTFTKKCSSCGDFGIEYGWEAYQSRIIVGGAGYRFSANNGLIFRLTGYVLSPTVNYKVYPWVGLSIGYALF